MDYQQYLTINFLGNTVQQYIIALLVLLLSLLVFKIFETKILKRLEKWAKKTDTDLDDEIIKTIENIPDLFYWVLSFYIALGTLKVPMLIMRALTITLIIFAFYWATKSASELISYILFKLSKKDGKKKGDRNNAYFALNLIAKLVLWSVGVLMILSNLGINVSAVVASLGIGGIAIALAVQNILTDIFSSFSIYFDKPFEVGDFIIVGDDMGTVKKIGLKTTRLQALSGEELVISNKELTSIRVHNYKKMKKRRIAFGVGVTYDTPGKKLEWIPGAIEKIIKKAKLADFDRAHFIKFADSSLNFEIVYFLNSADYLDYMNTQQEINLGIKEAFEKEGIEMAFPTRTIHMVKD